MVPAGAAARGPSSPGSNGPPTRPRPGPTSTWSCPAPTPSASRSGAARPASSSSCALGRERRPGCRAAFRGSSRSGRSGRYPGPAITRFLPRLGLPKGRWMAVEKRRRMTTIPYGGDSGCNVELTALEASGQTLVDAGVRVVRAGTRPRPGPRGGGRAVLRLRSTSRAAWHLAVLRLPRLAGDALTGGSVREVGCDTAPMRNRVAAAVGVDDPARRADRLGPDLDPRRTPPPSPSRRPTDARRPTSTRSSG